MPIPSWTKVNKLIHRKTREHANYCESTYPFPYTHYCDCGREQQFNKLLGKAIRKRKRQKELQ